MELNDLRKKTKDELVGLLTETKKELEDSTRDLFKGKNKNVKLPKKLRKEIARIKTILNEKQILEEVENA